MGKSRRSSRVGLWSTSRLLCTHSSLNPWFCSTDAHVGLFAVFIIEKKPTYVCTLKVHIHVGQGSNVYSLEISYMEVDQALFTAGTLPAGLPGWLRGRESACCWRHGFNPRVGKIPWRRKWQPTPVFLPGVAYGQRSLAAHSPRGREESDRAEQQQQQVFLFLGGGPASLGGSPHLSCAQRRTEAA